MNIVKFKLLNLSTNKSWKTNIDKSLRFHKILQTMEGQCIVVISKSKLSLSNIYAYVHNTHSLFFFRLQLTQFIFIKYISE